MYTGFLFLFQQADRANWFPVLKDLGDGFLRYWFLQRADAEGSGDWLLAPRVLTQGSIVDGKDPIKT